MTAEPGGRDAKPFSAASPASDPPTAIQGILPASVACAESRGDFPEASLFPEEEEMMARAFPKRRLEFSAGRHCARRSLALLGLPAVPLLSDDRGRPRWPDGVTGSITHCPGYRGAALARTDEFCALGIDAEPNEPLPEGVLQAVCGAAEHAHVVALARRHPHICWDRLLFSGKEAAYKVLSPLTGRRIGLRQAVMIMDASGTFRVQPAPQAPSDAIPRAGLHGRWRMTGRLLLTAIALPRTGCPTTADQPFVGQNRST